ncbi:MAG TPA: helix-turn-helix domain-containing protein [Streptosporangiaceae bacterium]|nr:helix-turn-helix domain-containing protein [Streptosporangiaceae bacterium]
MPADRKIAPRSDVQRNRQVLLQAARELFAVGSDVPMYEVARRAGVGQATLYRHFPDRAALAGAIAEELIEDLEELAARSAGRPDAFYVLLRGLVDTAARSGGLIQVVREDTGGQPQVERLLKRLGAMFAGPLREAKASGTVRADFGADDVILVITMVQGALDEADAGPAPRAAAAGRALDLLLHGIEGRQVP